MGHKTWKNQTCWFNTSHSKSQHAGFYESGIEAVLYGYYQQQWQGKKNLFWWSLLFSFEIPASFPHRLFPFLSVSPSHREHCAIYLLYMNSPSYIMLYQFSLIPTHFLCPLSYSQAFPRPTFHLFLWGVFLSDIDWVYLSAAVKLWKWVVSLVILCCLLSHYQ